MGGHMHEYGPTEIYGCHMTAHLLIGSVDVYWPILTYSYNFIHSYDLCQLTNIWVCRKIGYPNISCLIIVFSRKKMYLLILFQYPSCLGNPYWPSHVMGWIHQPGPIFSCDRCCLALRRITAATAASKFRWFSAGVSTKTVAWNIEKCHRSQFCFEHQVTVFSHFPLNPAWRHLQTWKKTFESYAGGCWVSLRWSVGVSENGVDLWNSYDQSGKYGKMMGKWWLTTGSWGPYF